MQLQIHPVELTDIEPFLDFCAELSAFDGTAPFERDSVRVAAEQLLQNPHLGRAVWLLADGTRAGYLVLSFGWSFEFGGRTAVLEHLFVRESFRRRGLADLAIEWAEGICAAENVGVVYLGVDSSNERAQSLYVKRGFQNSNLLFWMKWL